MPDTVIVVADLVKRYGSLVAVNGISFQVERAEVFGMLGPNGAGKTTTVEIIEGLRTADSGHVSVLGMDITKMPDSVKQRIGAQLQAPSLLPRLRVNEILDTFADFYKRRLPTDDLLKMFALEPSRKVLVKDLSGGQQQRLSVAMAMVNDPEIAFLDEPTTGLDPQARRGLWSVITGMKSHGKTVLLTTHNMEEAERLCDRVAIVDHGKIIAMDSPRNLVTHCFAEKAIQFDLEPPPPQDFLRTLPGVTQATVDGSEVIVYSRDITSAMSGLLRWAEEKGLTAALKDLHVREATLEDVFIKLTGRKIRE